MEKRTATVITRTATVTKNEALIASELRYRRLFETARSGIILVDFDTGMILDVNPFLINLLGYSKEDFLEKHLWEIGVFRDVAASKENFLILQQKKYVRFEDLPLETKTGKKIDVEFISSVYQVDGMTMIQCDIRDITNQKLMMRDLENANIAVRNVYEDLQAEKEKLADAKAKDEAMLASIGAGIIAIDMQGKIIVMNTLAEKLLGWDIEEAIGSRYDDVILLEDAKGTSVLPEERPLAQAIANRTTTTTTTTTTTLYLLSKNKIKFPVSIIVSPIILDNKMIGAVEVFRDITKEQEIDKEKTEFISIASHQLRTPVSGLSWVIEALQIDSDAYSPKQQKHINDLAAMLKRLTRLIEDLLRFSKIELELETVKSSVEVEFSVMFGKFVDDMNAYATQKHHALVVNNRVPEPLTIKTDMKALFNVFENLISNAIEYSNEGEPVVIQADSVGNRVKISVLNKGVAITEEDRAHLFQRFYRGALGKQMKPEGSGMGLYIAKKIVKSLGGDIGYESKDSDTMFWFTIPR